MKIFQTGRKHLISIGICEDRVSFGLLEWMHIFGYILYVMLLTVYIVHVAETTKQYMEAISKIAVTISVLVAYLSFRYNSQTLYKIIDDLEVAINKCEYGIKTKIENK